MLNGAFFYLCILSLTKKYLLPDKSTFFIGFPLLLLAYLINQGGLTKRGRVMEGIFWFVLLPLIFVLILSMANLSWDELAVRSWRGNEMINGSIFVFALMHPIELVWFYHWRYERWSNHFRSFAGLTLLFGVSALRNYCRFSWKETYNDRSRTCGMSMVQESQCQEGSWQDWIFF